MRKIIVTAFLLALPLILRADATPQDINDNGVLDSSEAEVVLESNFSLPAGEYIYNNLTVTNGATLILLSDPNSANTFKGVKITAVNLTVSNSSSISADGKGYGNNMGPGSGGQTYYKYGASYGGVGISNTATSTYGSATVPLDLGSGSSYPGGGAIWLEVSNDFVNDGAVSASGLHSGSGGSLYIRAKNIMGGGLFRANGGPLFASGYFAGPGGGGRIAIYYESSSFIGEVLVNGGCGSYDGFSQTCAERGTAGLFDITNNNLFIRSSWQFLYSDGSFNLNKINATPGSKIKSENGTLVKANELTLNDQSSIDVFGNSDLQISRISLSNLSTLNLLGEGTLTLDDLSLENESFIITSPEKVVSINVKNIFISSNSAINVNAKGYGQNSGPGAPGLDSRNGASHGGVGMGNGVDSTYGSSTAPTDFGSGGNGNFPNGGGVIRIVSTESFVNDGTISANAGGTGSGGSIFVTANNLSGVGVFGALGGNVYCPNFCYLPGGGGRIAIYYEDTNFTGEIDARGGLCPQCGARGGEGTVVYEKYYPSVSQDIVGTSVMFFPGVMGTRLYEEGDEKWVSTLDSDHDKLSLSNDGVSQYHVYTKDDTQSMNDEAETGITDEILGSNIYNSFINDLREWKSDRVINDYAFIPYDWRLSLEDIVMKGATTTGGVLDYDNTQDFSESYILKKLEKLSATSSKITLIGHSNGGLVIKALVQKLKDTNNPLYYKIDKIIFVAVPQIGTPEAVLGLLHGTSLGQGIIMKNERLRQLSLNMPAIYNLLPSNSYFETVDGFSPNSQIVTFENNAVYSDKLNQFGNAVTSQEELKGYILGDEGRLMPDYNDTDTPGIGNPVLYEQTEAVHAILDSWAPATTTKVIQIAGWGEETLAGIEYKTCSYAYLVYYKCLSPRFVVDGDGTVVTPSALWMSTTSPNVERWWVDLKEYNSIFSPNLSRIHRDLLEIPSISNLIYNKINNLEFDDDKHIVLKNASELNTNGTRLHYVLHSPLTLGVTDSQGRYTGLDPITGELEEEIPDVNYRVIGNTQFISVPSDLSGQVKLSGYEDGVFALDITKQEGNNILESTSFQGLPSSTTTEVFMDISPSVASSTLKIDSNGDGQIDATLSGKLGEIVTLPKYKWSGFLQPINDLSFNPNQKQSVFKGGSTVPVKFQLRNSLRVVVQASSSAVWLAPQRGGPMSATIDESVYTVSGSNGTEFKFDPISQQYSYNWSTKGFATGYWYKLSVKLDDGNVYSVVVGLR
ncbi:MAG: PxKF domain-containing protein [Minisyncoccia bacterium]